MTHPTPPQTMRAAVLERFGTPLRVTDVEMPRLRPEHVLIRVRACGLCGSDLKLADGELSLVRLPLIPGHEISGEVVDGAADLRPGQRVACFMILACGTCEDCRRGNTSLCRVGGRMGVNIPGGMAEYAVAPRTALIPFSDGLRFDRAAVTMDAVTTSWRALLTRGRLRRGDTVAIVGAGGLGLNAVQIAIAHGARVAVVEPLEDARQLAMKYGAELAVDPRDLGSAQRWAPDGVDLAVEFSGDSGGFQSAVEMARLGGTVVVVGYKPGLSYGADSARIVLDEISVIGSRGGTIDDARAALDAVERGIIAPVIDDRHLSLNQVNDGLSILGAGAPHGRLVVRP